MTISQRVIGDCDPKVEFRDEALAASAFTSATMKELRNENTRLLLWLRNMTIMTLAEIGDATTELYIKDLKTLVPETRKILKSQNKNTSK